MKILILCHTPSALTGIQKINNLSTIYAYFFNKWLQKYKDCEITNASVGMTPSEINALGQYDFCIVLVNRGIVKMKPNIYIMLRKKIKYHIITICETNPIMGNENLLLFTMGSLKPKTMRLFWGADFDLLKPQKSNTITVLVDHKYYGKKTSRLYKMDRTEVIIKSLLKYKNAGHNIIIKHIGYGKINEVTNNYIIEEYKQGCAIDFREIYKHYNNAHIYVVTHPESFGLSAVECAAAGALIVEPNGYMKKEIINILHHVSLNDVNNIKWDEIINKINIPLSRSKAKQFSYENAINQVYKYMSNVYAGIVPTKLVNKPTVVSKNKLARTAMASKVHIKKLKK